jgi:hypothetical protein
MVILGAKVKTSNINSSFGLGFRNPWCLGHLCCLNDFCEHFLHSGVHNEITQNGDYTQIPLVGHFAPSFHVYTIVYKFCVACVFCVNNYPFHMYYVIHKLQSLSRATICLGMHEHPAANGGCKDDLEEIKVLVRVQTL